MLLDLLQSELISLSTEAKKKGVENVKEAAEKLLFNLKKIKNDDSEDVVEELEKCSETMVPFMLSFESKQPKLISISVGCVLRLISQNAVPQMSLSSLLTCLSSTDSTMAVLEVQFKILQILLPFCTNYSKVVHGELLSSCLALCFKYSMDSKQPILSNTASATFRQMILHVFERMDTEDVTRASSPAANDLSIITPKANFASLYKRDGLALFQDLCCIINGEQGSFPGMQKMMALELTETIISSIPTIFKKTPEMLSLIKDKICPNLIRFFSEKTEFPLMVRLVRTVRVIVKQFINLLAMECEIFLTLFCKIIETSQYMAWQRILILEFLKTILNETGLQRIIYDTFDRADHAVNVYGDVVAALSAVVFDARGYLFYFASVNSPGSSQPGDEVVALSTLTGSLKMPCLDQMEKGEAPSFPDAYPILIAFQCLGYIVEQQSELTSLDVPVNQPNPPQSANQDLKVEGEDGSKDVLLAIEMSKSTASNIFYSLSIFLVASTDEELFGKTLKFINKYTTFLGLLGLVSFRDAFLYLLCKTCISSQLPMQMDSWKAIPKSVDLMTFSNAGATKSLVIMADKNMLIFSCLLSTVEGMADVMDAKTWFFVIDTVAVVESLIQPKAQFRRMESISDSSQTMPAKETLKVKTGGNVSYMESYVGRVHNVGVDFQLQASQYGTQSKHLWDLTCGMKQKPFMEFIRGLCRMAHESIATSGNYNPSQPQAKEKTVDEKSFSITKLQEICLMNVKRIVAEDDTFFELVSQQLINLSHLPNCPVSIRTQACFAFGEILLAASQENEFSSNEVIELRLLESIRVLMAFEQRPDNDVLVPEQNDHSLSRLPFLIDIRKQGLEIINKILQRSGQNIRSGWLVLLETVYFVVQSGTSQRKASVSNDTDSLANFKNSQLIRVGFPSVQLICTDFMSCLSPMGLSRCIQTVSAFGKSSEDLNISLTAVGLLWSLCDFILTKRQKLEKIEEEQCEEQSSNTNKGSLLDLSLLSGPVKVATMDTLWMYLLRNLSELCSDYRPEVRNSANQTLFRTISMNGQRLTLDSWDLCLGHVLFPLLDRIKSSAPHGPEIDKPWDDTKVLTLNGITKSLTDFLPVLIQLEDRFDEDWKRFLDYMKTTCLQSSQEVAIATLKCFKSLINYATKDDIPAEVIPKITTLWRTLYNVWYELGIEIYQQADESLLNTVELDVSQNIFQWTDGSFPTLLQGPFSQDSLALYCSLIFDIHPIIKNVFNTRDFVNVARTFQRLALYHSKAATNATPSRLRADVVNDLDTMTPCQSVFLEFISGGKLEVDFGEEIKDEVALLLSDCILYPFIPFPSTTAGELNYISSVKKHSFMVFSKKSLLLLALHFEKPNMIALLESGSFGIALKSLSIPLKYKYSCPPTSGKDPISFYRASADTVLSLLNGSIATLSELSPDYNQESLIRIYDSIVNIIDVFLLCGSISHHPSTSDQFLDDEAFDLSVQSFVEKKLFVFFGQAHIPEVFSKRLVHVLIKLSGYDFNSPPLPLNLKGNEFSMSALKLLSPDGNFMSISRLTSPVGSTTLLLGPDVASPQREKAANASLELLFRICSIDTPEKCITSRVAENTIPVLIEKCRQILVDFVHDRPISGKLPLPRSRSQEVLLVLKSLSTLRVRHTIPAQPSTPQILDNQAVRAFLLSSDTSVLFILYPVLCELLGVVSGHEDAILAELVLACFKRIGSIFE